VGRREGISVAISRQFNNPAEIVDVNIVREPKNYWTGMLRIDSYVKIRFHQLGLHSDLAKRAIVQALPYAVRQAVDLLQPEDLCEYDSGLKPAWKETSERKRLYNPEIRRNLPVELASLVGTIFPGEDRLLPVVSAFIGVETEAPVPGLPEGMVIADLPLVIMYRERLRTQCKCVHCDEAAISQYAACIKNRWLSSLASLVADILAFSLLDLTEPALVYVKSHIISQQATHFETSIQRVLAEAKPTPCYAEVVIDFVLNVVGHSVSALKENWIISAYRGQCIYPRLFETESLGRQGLLVMSGGPGVLRYNHEVYNKGMAAKEEFRVQLGEPASHVSSLKIPVQRPQNLLEGHQIKWEVTTGDQSLYISLLSTCATATFSPFAVLCAAVQSVYVDQCPHDPDAELVEPDPFAVFTSPYEPWASSDAVGVVAVHGNASLPMFSFVRGIPGVVQQKGCLQCAINICRMAGYRFVIDGN